MRLMLLFAITLTMLITTISARSAIAQQNGNEQKRESPFACNVTALNAAERKRHFDELGPSLRTLIRSIHELPNGYEFEFPSDQATYQMLTEWTDGERRCCPFFDITVQIDREGGPLWLRLTGRTGTKDFIKSEFAPWYKK